MAEIAGARKKRRLSEAHKAKLAEANQAYRFKPKFAASETPEKAQIRTEGEQDIFICAGSQRGKF